MPLCPPVVSCCSLPLRVFAPLLATFSCHRLPLWVMFSGRLLPFPLPCHVCAAQLSSAAFVCRRRFLPLPSLCLVCLLQPSFCAAARCFISSCPESGLENVCCACEAFVFFLFCWAPFLRALFLHGGSSSCMLVFARVLCVFA